MTRREDLTAAEVWEHFEQPNVPVVLTAQTKAWRAMQTWTPDQLQRNYGDIKLEVVDEYAGPIEMRVSSFMQYATAVDDGGGSPLYLFEPVGLRNVPP